MEERTKLDGWKQQLDIECIYIKSKLSEILNRDVFSSVSLHDSGGIEKILFMFDELEYDASCHFSGASKKRIILKHITYDILWGLYLKSLGDSNWKAYLSLNHRLK